MNSQEFAQSIRNKYPNGVSFDGISYSEMDDEELTRRVLKKYPAYQSQVQTEGAIGEFVSGVKSSLQERGAKISEEYKKPVTKEEKIKTAISPGLSRRGLRIAGQAAGAVGDIEMEVLKLIAPKFVEDFVAAAGEKVTETKVVQDFAKKYSELKEKHPEAMQDIEDVLNIAAVIPELKAAEAAIKGTTKAVKTISRVTGEVLDTHRLSRVANASDEIDTVVGKIVQGKTRDISKAKKALSTIDTTGVKTYSELGEKIDDGIEALAKKVDDSLEKADIGALKPKDLVTTTKVGSKTVKQKFVNDAINQLDELYKKIKDAPSLARIQELKTKLSKEGLTLKELNDLAREYGREFKNKAFSKVSQEPLTSVNAQAFENTRKGIKNVVRSKMPDDVTKMLDQRMSEMFNTSHLVRKMEEKVNSLYQRAKKRGILEKVSRKVADVVDAATFGTVSGFVSRLLPSNVGLKVMNSIDLENALSKNLKKLDKLLKVTNDKLLEDGIVKLLKS